VAYVCGFCGSSGWESWESSGEGTVFSYTFIRHPRVTFVPDDAAVAVISLEDGLRFPSNVLNVSPDDITFGTRVQLVWEPIHSEDGQTEFVLPMFVVA
jgi:uncharacterized OB-fold protein